MAKTTLMQQREQRNRSPKRRFVICSCVAGVAIGLYAGVVSKGSEQPQGADWKFLEYKVAEGQITSSVPQ